MRGCNNPLSSSAFFRLLILQLLTVTDSAQFFRNRIRRLAVFSSAVSTGQWLSSGIFLTKARNIRSPSVGSRSPFFLYFTGRAARGEGRAQDPPGP